MLSGGRRGEPMLRRCLIKEFLLLAGQRGHPLQTGGFVLVLRGMESGHQRMVGRLVVTRGERGRIGIQKGGIHVVVRVGDIGHSGPGS